MDRRRSGSHQDGKMRTRLGVAVHIERRFHGTESRGADEQRDASALAEELLQDRAIVGVEGEAAAGMRDIPADTPQAGARFHQFAQRRLFPPGKPEPRPQRMLAFERRAIDNADYLATALAVEHTADFQPAMSERVEAIDRPRANRLHHGMGVFDNA